ncbi:MAG TPA: hypothetical protein VOA41_00375 [Candidatus Dormibacteraeota bacterium]|nr:hypothetical protein [Candidatus Dormibacteraeota bacterium]
MSTSPRVPPHAPGDKGLVHEDVAYDRSDVRPGSVLAFLLYLALGLAVAFLSAWGCLRLIESRTARFDAPASPLRQGIEKQRPPEPRLQGVIGHANDPQQDLREMRSHTEKDLSSFGWVDENQGIARIPIEEAMKLIVAKGLGRQSQPQQPKPSPKAVGKK